MKRFENFNNEILLIIDVQKSFSDFFSDNYLSKLAEHCKSFNDVYQIWDNHIDGKNVDVDYLYDETPDVDVNHDDLYHFPNQKKLIEKRYTYDVNISFFEKILDESLYNKIKNNNFKLGDYYETNKGTSIIYTDNNHKWFHISKRMKEVFEIMKGCTVEIVGGADKECLQDIEIALNHFGIKFKRNEKLIYSAKGSKI